MGEKSQGFQERKYRNLLLDEGFISYEVKVKETDLHIRTAHDLQPLALQSILRYRYQLEKYIVQEPGFLRSLVPVGVDEFAPPIVREMIRVAQLAGVGPMAAVAGAMAEFVGRDLLAESSEVIVENGGDIFLFSAKASRVGIFAHTSPLSFRVGLRIPPTRQGWGVCTSSGTVGPSLSLGRADAVCVLSPSAALADAAATAVGNLIRSPSDVSRGLEKAQSIPGLTGAVIIIGEKLGAWGEMELIEI